MNNFINAIKAQMFDQIVKQAKGTKDDPTPLLQLISNNADSIAFTEKSLELTRGINAEHTTN